MEKEKPKAWREGRDFRTNSGRVIGAMLWVFIAALAVLDWLACFFSGIAIGAVLALIVQGQLLGALMLWAAYSAIILAQGQGSCCDARPRRPGFRPANRDKS